MIKYVVGFVFTQDKRVVLIEKKRPDWQYGKLNGVGGHINENEKPIDAMVREFEEETGIYLPQKRWREFCQLEHKKRNGYVHFFTAKANDAELSRLMQTTDEKPRIISVSAFMICDILPNLKWLIPMALQDNVYANIIDGEK